jgi:hypothetical protein
MDQETALSWGAEQIVTELAGAIASAVSHAAYDPMQAEGIISKVRAGLSPEDAEYLARLASQPTWELPAEPGPEVTSVRVAGSIYDRSEHGWTYRIPESSRSKGLRGTTSAWIQLLKEGTVTNATGVES